MVSHRIRYFACCSFFLLFSFFCFNPVLAAEGHIDLIAPGSDAEWEPGSTQTISWSLSDADELGLKVNISLYKDGALRSVIKSGVSTGENGSGSFSWTLPTGLPSGSKYQVKVLSAAHPDIFDMSSNFTIAPEESSQQTDQTVSYSILSPAAGDVWEKGTEQSIQWNYSGNPGSQTTITLFKGGKSKLHIASKTPTGQNGSGSYSWTLPATLAEGSDYQIKVLSPTCPDGAFSGNFTINSATSTADDNEADNTDTDQNQQTQENQDSSAQNGTIRVILNGQLMSFDQPPVIIGGSTMVPMRAIFEALGASITWDASTQTVKAAKGNITISLLIGAQTAMVNGIETPLSQAAQILNGRTLVPLRFVAESLQAEVLWDGNARTITITQDDTAHPNDQDTSDPSALSGGMELIHQFFNLVDSGDISKALRLLDVEALGDDSSQAMWNDSLSSISSASVSSIEESNKAEWPGDFEQYKVLVSLQVSPGGKTLWTDGNNTFWISLNRSNGQWRILEIATGG